MNGNMDINMVRNNDINGKGYSDSDKDININMNKYIIINRDMYVGRTQIGIEAYMCI